MVTAAVSTQNLLVVDNVSTLRATLRDMFLAEGFDVFECGTIEDALQLCQEHSFAIAVMDLQLGDHNGIELLASIRQAQPGIRVIIHSAHRSFDTAKNALNHGAFAFVEKQGEPGELVSQVNRAFRERLTEKLTQSDQRFRDLLDDVAAIVWECELPSLRFTYVSQHAESILGYPVSRWIDEPDFWVNLLHPDDRRRCVEFCSESTRRGEDHDFDYRAVAADGRIVWLHEVVHIVRGEHGVPVHLRGVMFDITDRMAAEADIRLRDYAFASSENGIVISDATRDDFPIVYCNPAFEQMTGYSQEELLGRNCRFLQGEDRDQPGRAAIRKALCEGKEVATTLRNYHKNGSMFWSEIRLSPVRDAEGRLTHYLGFQTDVTKRREAEIRSTESEHRFRAIFNSTFQFIGLLSPDGTVLEANQTALNFSGLKSDEVLNRPFWEAPWWRGNDMEIQRLREAVQRAATGQFVRYDMQVQGIETTETVDFSIKPVFDEAGKIQMLVPEGRMIGDQKRAEKALRESEERYRRLVEHAPWCIHELDENGNLASMNQAGLRLLGVADEAELIGQSYLSFVVPSDRERIGNFIALAFGGQSNHLEYESVTGQHFESCFVPLTDQAGDVDRIMGITQDVTDRLAAEQKLRDSEGKFRAMFEQATVGVALFDSRSGKFLEVNQRYCDIAGHTRDQMLELDFASITHPDDIKLDRDNTARLAAGEISEFAMEKRYIRNDGSFTWANLTVSPLRHSGEQLSTHIAIVEDITRRKQAQFRLLESEGLFRGLVETAPFGVQRNGVDGRITFANAALGRIYGREPDHLIGGFIWDFAINDQVREKMQYYVKRQVADPKSAPVGFDTRNRTCDGRIIDVRVDWTYDRDQHGNIIGFIVIVTDITSRKQSERELEFQADVLNRVSDAVLVTDGNQVVTYANDTAKRIFGVSTSRQIPTGLYAELFVTGQSSDAISSSLQENWSWQGENEFFVNDESRCFDTKLKTFQSSDSDDLYLLSVMRDISSRKQAEQEIREHAQMLAHVTRLSTMGELVAGIAHEVKQPLYAVANFATAASVMLDNVQPTRTIEQDLLDELKQWNDGVRNAAQRASDIIKHSLAFARKGDRRREIINVNQCLYDSMKLISFEARQCGATIVLELARGLPDVVAMRIQFEQVMVNLLHNAIENLSGYDTPRRIIVRTKEIDGFVEVLVADNGPGISVRERGKLFDAFYTTKRDGMGMGLAISRTIVEDHEGHLWVTENSEGGSTFHFTLPVESNAAAVPSGEDV